MLQIRSNPSVILLYSCFSALYFQYSNFVLYQRIKLDIKMDYVSLLQPCTISYRSKALSLVQADKTDGNYTLLGLPLLFDGSWDIHRSRWLVFPRVGIESCAAMISFTASKRYRSHLFACEVAKIEVSQPST